MTQKSFVTVGYFDLMKIRKESDSVSDTVSVLRKELQPETSIKGPDFFLNGQKTFGYG